MTLWDYSLAGWGGGGVFLTDFNDCLVMHATAPGVANSTAYFTVAAGVDDASATCVNASLVRDRSQGWCTFDYANMFSTCNAVDTRSEITDASSAAQRTCKAGGGY